MKKSLAVLFVLCIGFAPLAAAGQQDASETDSGEKKVVTVWYHAYGEEGVKEAVTRYGEMYEEVAPDVDIQVNWIVGDWRQKLYAALASKASDPDVFEENAPSVTMVRAGQVEPLDDILSERVLKDFIPAAKDANFVEGRYYGVRKFLDATGFYYNKAMFEEAGVSEPETFSELIEISKKLTTSDRKGAYIGNSAGVGTFGYMVAWNSGIEGLISDDNKTVIFDTPNMVAAMEALREYAETDALLMGYPVSEYQPDALVNEECAIQWGGMWSFPQFKEQMGDNFGVFPMPVIDGYGTENVASGNGFSAMVNGFSDQKEAAKAYIKWAWVDETGMDIQIDFSTAYGFHMPAKESNFAISNKLMEDPRSKKMVDFTSANSVFKVGGGYSNNSYWDSSMNTIFKDMLADVVKTDKPVEELVRNAAIACQARLDELQ